MNKSFLTGAIAALLLSSCGGSNDTETGENQVEEQQAVCTYSYNPDETILTWTAFKLSNRTGVSGTFDEINVSGNQESDDMFAVLTGASFDIPVSSLNSQDEIRDPKIKNSFFGVMDETNNITGSIVKMNGKSGTIEITMNGKTVSYDGEVKVEGEELKWMTEINIQDFDGSEAMDSLGVVCAEKHTGEDGMNVLWNEVEIAVKTTFTKTCE